jgi:hypothetical protein
MESGPSGICNSISSNLLFWDNSYYKNFAIYLIPLNYLLRKQKSPYHHIKGNPAILNKDPWLSVLTLQKVWLYLQLILTILL